ncbi:MAG: EamA family transporter [Acidimicrobiia bacterium]|nr:EamA family transporter [Acidimicrobiia bacterium]
MPYDTTTMRRSIVAVALAAALFATTGTAAELGPDALSPRAAGTWRAMIGGLGLLTWIRLRHGKLPIRPVDWRWVLLGGIAVAGYQLTFFDAVARTGVAVGTLVTIGTGPIVAGVIDASVARRAPTLRWISGAAAGLAGVALLTAGTIDVDLGGILLALIAGATFPVYGLAAQRLMRQVASDVAIGTVFVAGAAVLTPLAVATASEAFASVESILTVGYLGVFTLSVAYILWGLGLERLTLGVVVVVTLLEPAVASILGVGVLGEPLTLALVVGVVLVAAGVVLASTSKPAAGTV